jgi:hypothetical protein
MVIAWIAMMQATPDTGLPAPFRPDSSDDGIPQMLAETTRATLESLLNWWGEEIPPAALEELRLLESETMDINAVTREQLESIPGVTPGEAIAFLDFRSRIGRFGSVEQLHGIAGRGEDLFRKAGPYLCIRSGRPGVLRFFSRVMRREYSSVAKPEERVMGSPFSLRSSLVLVPAPGVTAGMTYDRDPGEKTREGFLSGFVELRDLPMATRIILGDFVVKAGQGLVLWSSAAPGKGMDVVAGVRRSGEGPRAYHSADEFHFFRGLALATGLTRLLVPFDLTFFLSRRSLAASIDSSGRVVSLYDDGLFTTEAALRRRNALHEDAVGCRLALRGSDRFHGGITFLHTLFDRDFAGGQKWDIKMPRVAIGSVDIAATAGPATLFGECAVSGMIPALNAGMILEWGSTLSVSLLYRNYPADFVSPHANGFGGGGSPANEQGLYFGCDIRALPWLSIRASVDTWKSPWRTYLNPLPVASSELLIGCEADLPHVARVTFQFRKREKEHTIAARDTLDRDVRETLNRRQERVRLGVEVPIGREVHLRARLDFGTVGYPVSGTKERGELVSQEVSWTIARNVTVTLHHAFFDSPSYGASVFEYERDLPGVYANPALYGKGSRWYFVIRGSVLKSVHLSFKVAATHCTGETSSVLPPQVADERSLSFQLDIHL